MVVLLLLNIIEDGGGVGAASPHFARRASAPCGMHLLGKRRKKGEKKKKKWVMRGVEIQACAFFFGRESQDWRGGGHARSAGPG